MKQLFRLLKFRNTCPAFDGTVEAEQADINNLRIIWKNGASEAKLEANLATKEFSIRYKDAETNWTLLM